MEKNTTPPGKDFEPRADSEINGRSGIDRESEPDVLTVHVGDAPDNQDEVRELIEAAKRDDDVEGVHRLTLHDDADVARLLSQTNLELLRVIAMAEPPSMRATAELVGRDISDVHRNLTELAELGVVTFEQDGRSKRPVVTFDRIEIDIPLRQ